MHILLVEDNEINLKLLVAYMRKLNLYHATAMNGLEALNTYKEAGGQFDVIFMGFSPHPHILSLHLPFVLNNILTAI
jgi:CheY-like chemotaxis protein